jgi:hypothetical protein
MTDLVTLDEAKLHCRLDHDLDDDVMAIYISAASAAVLQYIGDTQYWFLDTGGDEIDLVDTTADVAGARAKQVCRQATLLLVADFFSNREAKADDPFFASTRGYGYFNRAVVALLYPLRNPTIA